MSGAGPSRTRWQAAVERFARAHPASVLFDGDATVLDVPSGKALRLEWTRIAGVEERRDAGSGRRWLAIARDDGTELGLAEAGIAFAPATAGTGPLDGLPRAVCFRDLAAAEAQLTHFLVGHPGEPPTREHVSTFLFCLAVVDGARAAGFDVTTEERRLERALAELEARRRG